MMPNIHPIQLIYLSRFNIPNVKHAAGKGWEACNDLWPPSICFTGVAKCWESGGPQGYPPPPPPPSIPSPPFCQKKRGRPPFQPPLFLHRRPLLPHGKSLGGCLEPMKQLGVCLCLSWQFTPSESPMTSVSFTVLSETTRPLSHDNLLCSGRLSILAITGVSDTIPPRLLLPRRAEPTEPSEPSPKFLRSSVRRRAARPFAGWRQRQVGVGGDRHAA